jgi:fructosamine-3-kinase
MVVKASIIQRISAAADDLPTKFSPLEGGCIGDVFRVDLKHGGAIVAKVGELGGGLAIEGMMLDYLARNSRLPVPQVLYAMDDLLVMSHIDGGDALNPQSQRHAAELLANLHGLTADQFGFPMDTLIGGLVQPNLWTDHWCEFFRDQRLLYMARQALDAGRLPRRLMRRIESLAEKLETWIDDAAQPSLLHGDLWTGNVLCKGNQIAGFVDPAVYYGDAEIELAFSTLFGTFGEPF